MSKENVEAFQALIEAVNRRDLDAHSALMAPDVEIVPIRAALESDTAYRGPDASAQWLAAIEQSWERLTADLEDFRVTGDCVLALGRIRARGRESGVDIDVPAAALARFHAGQVVYLRVYTDQDAALEAAGLSE